MKDLQAPLNILLAEDDLDDRLFFEKALKEISFGASLTTVNDGDELMHFLLQPSVALPDVLFLDLSMPGKTGFECLTEIKEDEDLKDIPVIIFTTSFGRSSEYEESLINTLTNIGSMAFIRKPGNFEELKKIIYDKLVMISDQKSVNM